MKFLINFLAVALVVLLGQLSLCVSAMAQESDVALTASKSLPDAPKPQPVQSEDSVAARRSMEAPTENIAGAPEGGASNPDAGSVSGTVTDVNGDIVPGVKVTLDGPQPDDRRVTVANDTAAFEFDALKAGIPYCVSIRAEGFLNWKSSPIVLTPGQHEFLTGVQLLLEGGETSVVVSASQDEIAAQQVRIEEQQRVLGVIPNFYVVYDSKNAAPLSAKLKFQLAMRVSIDPVTVAGIGILAAARQAGDTPNYVEGARGYGQRFGAEAATGFSDILIGGAVLPSLLHQDPRYFYQGEGTNSSRLRHALFSPFICRGDNGRPQVNFSSLGGDLASSALTETYYPDSNRGPRLVFGNFAIGTGERMVSAVVQEFVLRRLTPRAGKQHFDQ
jgi:Carboxypeptidase regulatory-like domain